MSLHFDWIYLRKNSLMRCLIRYRVRLLLLKKCLYFQTTEHFIDTGEFELDPKYQVIFFEPLYAHQQ